MDDIKNTFRIIQIKHPLLDDLQNHPNLDQILSTFQCLYKKWASVITGLDYWTGPLNWTTGL